MMGCSRTSLPALLCSFLFCSVVAPTEAVEEVPPHHPSAKKKRGDDEDDTKQFPLPRHSFKLPLEYSSLLDDWELSGASLFERNRLLLHPGVPQVAGFAFNKKPLRTDNFRVTFQFHVSSTDDGKSKNAVATPPQDQSFALWYVQADMATVFNETKAIHATTWERGLDEQGMTFSGSKARFDGIGVVFSFKSSKSISVSLVSNDGTRDLNLKLDVPSAHTKAFDILQNPLDHAQLQLRVKKNSVKGFIRLKGSGNREWQECFSTELPQKLGGYLGFSAWSGGAANEENQFSNLVSLVGLEVTNFDETVMGEDMLSPDVSSEIQNAYKEMLTDDKRHFVDQKSQTEHLNRLMGMLGQHLASAKPAEEKMFKDLQLLAGRMGDLGEDCGTLAKEARLLLTPHNQQAEGSPPAGHAAHVEAMKNEIIGLRRALVKDSVTHRAKLEAVQKNVAEVKQKSLTQASGQSLSKIAEQSKTLEKTVSSRGTQMSWMLVCMLAAILAIGGLMYNRMQYYEKKHFI